MENIIPEESIQEVRQHFDLVDIISSYTALKKSGRNYLGMCPFHSEKNPSFTVSREKQLYYCFGCGAGGDLFNFIMAVENLSFVEAVRFLAARGGISLPERKLSNQEKKIKLLREELLKINEISMNYFQRALFRTEPGKKALSYLKKRSLLVTSIKRFKIGFSLSRGNDLYRFLKNKGFGETYIEKAGLIIPQTKRAGYYDRFRNRIMFPIFNLQNQVIGFGGRVLDDFQPKYLNSPETPLYNKRKNLYGLNFARSSIREFDEAVVFEGYFDVITAVQNGLENCVASLGTSLTEEQAELFRRNTSNIIIAYDPDTAGEAATRRSMDLLTSAGCRVKVAQMPEGHDPDEFIRKRGIKAFKTEIIQQTLPLTDYKLMKVRQEIAVSPSDSPDKKMTYLNKVLPVLAGLTNSVEYDLYLQKVSSEIGVNPNSLKFEIKKFKNKKNKPYFHKKEAAAAREGIKPPAAEKKLLNLMLKSRDAVVVVKKWLDADDFSFKEYRAIVEKIYYLEEMEKDISINSILNLISDTETQKTLVSLSMREDFNIDNWGKIISDCVKRIKSDQLSLKRKKIEQSIEELDKERDAEKIKELLEKWTELKRMERELCLIEGRSKNDR